MRESRSIYCARTKRATQRASTFRLPNIRKYFHSDMSAISSISHIVEPKAILEGVSINWLNNFSCLNDTARPAMSGKQGSESGKGRERQKEEQKNIEKFSIKLFRKVWVCFFSFIRSLVLFADGGGDGGSFKTVTSFSSRHGCDCIRCRNDNLYKRDTVLESVERHASTIRMQLVVFAQRAHTDSHSFSIARTCVSGVCVCMIRRLGDDKRVPQKCHESITRGSVYVCARSRPRCAVRGYRPSLR